MEKILENYHIKINKFLDGQYIDGQYIDLFLKTNDFGFSEMTYKIQCGHNENEIQLVPKNLRKKGFFEKFFQFFG